MRRRRLKNEETANGAQEEVRRLLISLPKVESDFPIFRLAEVAGEVESQWKLVTAMKKQRKSAVNNA